MPTIWQDVMQSLYFFPLSITNKWAELYGGAAWPIPISHVKLFSHVHFSCIPSVVRWVHHK